MMNSLMSLSGDRYTPWEYSRGVLELAQRVRDAIGPDRVVLCESTSGQLGQCVHGGLSSDLGQAVAHQRWRNQNRILASPVRYGMPWVNFISNGLDMNEPSDLRRRFYRAIGYPDDWEDPSNKLLDVETQLGWLRELGFDDVDCYWKWLEMALLIGVKPVEG